MLVAMVAANWPTELGSGWHLGFDRSSERRTLYIVHSETDVEDESSIRSRREASQVVRRLF